jgi:FkbM family methyltransferase
MHPVRIARHLTRLARRRIFSPPEERAWRRFRDYAERWPRSGLHALDALGLYLEFPDPGAMASQWHDLFIRNTLDLQCGVEAPRILDCGAHVGLASLWMKRRWPRARITAFEADPQIARLLRANLARNGASDVEVVEAAVWRCDGDVAFCAAGSDAGAVAAVAAAPGEASIRVRSVRLRHWLTEPIDLLKLDIEGAELDVLEDSADRLHHVRAVHLEVHDFDSARRLLPGCLTRLSGAGFVYALSDLGSALWRPGVAASGPFRGAVPSWVVCVRAWRPSSDGRKT